MAEVYKSSHGMALSRFANLEIFRARTAEKLRDFLRALPMYAELVHIDKEGMSWIAFVNFDRPVIKKNEVKKSSRKVKGSRNG